MENTQYCSLENEWATKNVPTITIEQLVEYLLALPQDWEVGFCTEDYGNQPMNTRDIDIIEDKKLILF